MEKCSGRQSDNESHPANQTSSGRSPNQCEAIPFTNRFSVSSRSINVLLDKYCTPSAASDCVQRSYPTAFPVALGVTIRINNSRFSGVITEPQNNSPTLFELSGSGPLSFNLFLREKHGQRTLPLGTPWRRHFACVGAGSAIQLPD